MSAQLLAGPIFEALKQDVADEKFGGMVLSACGKRAYACDGRMLIVVEPPPHGVERHESHTPLLDGLFASHWIPSALRRWSLPDLPPREVCRACLGSRKRSECADCDGEGAIICDQGEEHDCQECGGSGQVDGSDAQCDKCDGLGFLESENTKANVGGVALCERYARAFASIEDFRFAPPAKTGAPAAFAWSGGCGLVMPTLCLDIAKLPAAVEVPS